MVKEFYRNIKKDLEKRDEVRYDILIIRPDVSEGLVVLLQYAGYKAEFDGRFLSVKR